MPVTKYRPEMLVDIYLWAKEGVSDSEIARRLGVDKLSFYGWKKNRPEVLATVKRGRKERDDKKGDLSYEEFSYGRLSPAMKKVWRRLRKYQASGNAIGKVEEMFRD